MPWPAQEDRRAELRSAGRARLLLLEGGVAPPPAIDELEDWIRMPAADLDESLLGLRSLALVADERAGTCLEAQQLFGRGCEVAQSS